MIIMQRAFFSVGGYNEWGEGEGGLCSFIITFLRKNKKKTFLFWFLFLWQMFISFDLSQSRTLQWRVRVKSNIIFSSVKKSLNKCFLFGFVNRGTKRVRQSFHVTYLVGVYGVEKLSLLCWTQWKKGSCGNMCS